MAAVSHDYLDRIWDYEGLAREERTYTRKYWEAFHVWLVLNPDLLKDWAGVDVLSGRIHRVIDGTETWEDEPEVKSEYRTLLDRARFLLYLDKELGYFVQRFGGCGASDHTST